MLRKKEVSEDETLAELFERAVQRWGFSVI